MAIKPTKSQKNRLGVLSKGKVEKKKRQNKGKQDGRGKRAKEDSFDYEDMQSEVVKKKPSKAILKQVIDALKKDAELVVVRKALKYVPHYLKSEGLTKKLLGEIIRLWAEAGEKVRVVCLLCLIRIYTKLKDKERKQMVVKKLYTSFLDKCRITKHETMSMIGFMRHSLIEIYKLDPQIAFKQAQIACQQLTVTLKNATTHKNEETYKTVLNWQFVNCLILLSSLIISHDDNSPVKSLTHQVTQLNLGAFHLLSSPRYYPFYCHIIENLINLSNRTNMFIPILPLLVNLLKRVKLEPETRTPKVTNGNGISNGKGKQNDKKFKKPTEDDDGDDDDESSSSGDDDEDDDINSNENDDDESDESDEGIDDEEHDADDVDKEAGSDDEKRAKSKVYNMDLLNHVSLEEAHCLEYQTAVLNKLHELTLKYLASQSHRIAFPELVLMPCIQIKKWIKTTPGKHSQKFKALLDKIKVDCSRIEEVRKSASFAFTNYAAVDAWEKKMKDSNKLTLPKMIMSNE